jgi:hypothetical protein
MCEQKEKMFMLMMGQQRKRKMRFDEVLLTVIELWQDQKPHKLLSRVPIKPHLARRWQ